MKLSFLCPNHRAELQRHPQKALQRWQQFYDTGVFFAEQQQHQEAIAHLGCAFETAEIILTARSHDLHDCLSLFGCSCATLARTYHQLRREDVSNDVVSLTTQRLRQEQTYSAHYYLLIENQIQTLHHFLDMPLSAEQLH